LIGRVTSAANVGGHRPGREQRESPVRCTTEFGAAMTGTRSLYDPIRAEHERLLK